MKKILYITILALVFISAFYNPVYPEQTQKDMFATVTVMPAFKLSLDNANISFGYVEPGKSVELYPHTHYNELNCISNKGNRWYLKLSVIGGIIGPENSSVGIDSFKWMVARSTGDGVPEKGWHSFAKEPVIAYTSGSADSTGSEVTVQFKYKLDLPPKAMGGNYNLNILYTMTDTP